MHRGYSLVEVLVALGILAVLGVGFSGVLRMGTRVADDARMSRALSALLTQRIEVLRSLSTDAFRALPLSSTETIRAGTWEFNVARTITEIENPNLYRVTFSAIRTDRPQQSVDRVIDIAPSP